MTTLFSLPGAPQQLFVQLWYPAATHPSAVGREPGQLTHLADFRLAKQGPGYIMGLPYPLGGQREQKKYVGGEGGWYSY